MMGKENVSAFRLCAALLLCTCLLAAARQQAEDYPADREEYYFMHFGGWSAMSPGSVIEADNNWAILLACVDGITSEELAAKGLGYRDSQMHLLLAMRLLAIRDDGSLVTSMPILGRARTAALRRQMRELAETIEPLLRDDISALNGELARIGREANAFTILFSYALDKIPWYYFGQRDLIDYDVPSRAKPLWGHVHWAVCPARDFFCGTNSCDAQLASLKVNWSEQALRVSDRIVWLDLCDIVMDYTDNGVVDNQELREQLRPYAVLDDEGRPTVPVIEASDDNPVYRLCSSIAQKAVNAFLDGADLDQMMERYGFYDQEKAVVVSFHEWMWELLDVLAERGAIVRPLAHCDPERATTEDLGSLFFIVTYPEEG